MRNIFTDSKDSVPTRFGYIAFIFIWLLLAVVFDIHKPSLFLSLGVVPLGALLISKSIIGWYRGLRSKRWPSAEGRVMVAKTLVVDSYGGGWATPKIIYMFIVKDKTYISDTVTFKGNMTINLNLFDPFGVKKTMFYKNKYPAESKVPVYYDPTNPKISCLEQGTSEWNIFEITVGLVCFVVGLFLLLSG